jgi:hypothetical protein
MRATVACALLLRPWVLRAACDRGVRASEGTVERTQVRSNVHWQLLSLSAFLPLLTMFQHNVLHNTKY